MMVSSGEEGKEREHTNTLAARRPGNKVSSSFVFHKGGRLIWQGIPQTQERGSHAEEPNISTNYAKLSVAPILHIRKLKLRS